MADIMLQTPNNMNGEASFAYPPNTTVIRVASISEVMQMRETLGSGTYATVKKGADHIVGMEKAVKLIEESTYKRTKKQLQNEVTVLSKFPTHPRIVSLNEIVRVPGKYFCIVTELVQGGDLFDYIVKANNGSLTESHAKKILAQIIEGVKVLHDMNIIHRDLKPENVLMAGTTEDNINVKIADFGIATFYSEDTPLVKNCGTTAYTAPEVLSRTPYGKACDMWSIGVIMYAMVHGYLPFHGSQDEMKEKILSGKYRFSRRTTLTRECKDLIKRMLCMDPAKRPTASNILEHPWFQEL